MQNLQKYRECLMYLGLIVIVVVFLFQQIQPKVMQAINLFNQVKSQKEVSQSINSQLNLAKEKVERKKKLRLLDDMTKKIYEPTGSAVDTESTYAVLMDDVIEISRKNHIKTHSIVQVPDPEDDVFVKGDKEHFGACRLDMKIVSDYTDFEGFIQDLYRYNYLININNIEIYPYSKNKRILLINLSITLYTSKVPGADPEQPKDGGGQPQEGQPQEGGDMQAPPMP